MEVKADLPYPSLDGIEEDYAALRIISPAYASRASEMTAILQYVYQSIVLGACGKEEIGGTLERIAVTEMHHLDLLGTLICKLGAAPVFTACPPYPVGYYSTSAVDYTHSVQKMLLSDIAAERAAIAKYEQMLCALKNERVAEVIKRIVEDEKIHVCVLEGLLKEV